MRTLAKEAITFRPDSVSPAGSVGPGRSPQGCRPPRHALRGAQPLLVAKTSRSLTKKSGTAKAIPDFFGNGKRACSRLPAGVLLPSGERPAPAEAGAETGAASATGGQRPSARGFGVDVRTAHKEQGRAGVVRFFSQERERVVLIWCCGKTFRGKAVFKSPLLEGLPPRDRIHITHRGLNRHRRLGRGFLLYPRRPYR